MMGPSTSDVFEAVLTKSLFVWLSLVTTCSIFVRVLLSSRDAFALHRLHDQTSSLLVPVLTGTNHTKTDV